MAAGMVLGPISSVHAEEITAPLTASDESETMTEVTEPAPVETPAETPTETPTVEPAVTPTEEPTVTPAAPDDTKENGSGENSSDGTQTDEKDPGEVTPTPSET